MYFCLSSAYLLASDQNANETSKSEEYEIILPPKRKSSENQYNKLDYLYYLNEKLQETEQWLDLTNTEITKLEKRWTYYSPYYKDETELECKIILEQDAYYSTTYPDGYYSTTYTAKANATTRVYCKEYLQRKEQEKLALESQLRELYKQRSQLEQNHQFILQELNK